MQTFNLLVLFAAVNATKQNGCKEVTTSKKPVHEMLKMDQGDGAQEQALNQLKALNHGAQAQALNQLKALNQFDNERLILEKIYHTLKHHRENLSKNDLNDHDHDLLLVVDSDLEFQDVEFQDDEFENHNLQFKKVIRKFKNQWQVKDEYNLLKIEIEARLMLKNLKELKSLVESGQALEEALEKFNLILHNLILERDDLHLDYRADLKNLKTKTDLKNLKTITDKQFELYVLELELKHLEQLIEHTPEHHLDLENELEIVENEKKQHLEMMIKHLKQKLKRQQLKTRGQRQLKRLEIELKKLMIKLEKPKQPKLNELNGQLNVLNEELKKLEIELAKQDG